MSPLYIILLSPVKKLCHLKGWTIIVYKRNQKQIYHLILIWEDSKGWTFSLKEALLSTPLHSTSLQPNSTAWFHHPARFFYNYSIKFNLGVIFDYQLTFKDHIEKTARSCRFALHNIRKIRPFLTQHAARLLVQALVTSRLDYCNALLAGLPSNTIKPFYRWFKMQPHDWSPANPKGPMSHLSLSACTGSRLQFASSSRHWCLHIEQPQAQHPPTFTHLWQSTSPPEAWDLWASIASWCHHREAQNHSPERFYSPFRAGGMNFPPPSWMPNPWPFSSDTWKLISSVITWLHLKNTIITKIHFP